MIGRVYFMTVPGVLKVHEAVISVGGGDLGVRDYYSLEAGVMAVQATYGGHLLLPSMADIAAGYTFYVATSHPFVDGNKRTSLATALVFLEMNGISVTITQREDWSNIMVAIATGSVTREIVAEFFAALIGDWGELDG